MPLPDLDHRGLLPPGVHEGSLIEIGQRFCTNPHRQALWATVEQFLRLSLLPLLNGRELILAGSFFSDKDLPEDIEATVIIDAIDVSDLPLIRLGLSRDTIHRDYKLDLYLTLRVPGHNDFSVFFQYVGPKTAAAKNLLPEDLRGVIKVT